MRISVVVPVYNARRTIARCVDALLRQTRRPDSIYFVDNGSSDGTYEWLQEQAAAASYMHVRREQTRGQAAARNAALRLLDEGIVAFTDADCVPEPEWLAQIAEAYTSPEIAAVSGSISEYEPQTLIERCLAITAFPQPDQATTITAYSPTTVFYTANLSVRVDVLRRFGLFDESMSTGEDLDLCWRILRGGGVIVGAPSACVRHIHRPTLSAALKRQFFYGAGRPRLMRKHFHGVASVMIGRHTITARAPVTICLNLTSPEKISMALIALSVLTPWSLIPLCLYWARLMLLIKHAAQKRNITVRSNIELAIFAGIHLLEFSASSAGSFLASRRHGVLCA